MAHAGMQGMSPLSSPHAIPAPVQSVASLPYPCSPTTSSTPPGTPTEYLYLGMLQPLLGRHHLLTQELTQDEQQMSMLCTPE